MGQQIREVICRTVYKKVKNYNREDMNLWLNEFGRELYNDGCRDSAMAEMTALKDEFDFDTDKIARFMKKRDAVIRAINERELDVQMILDGLREEGLSITTDFEPEVRQVKDVRDYDNKPV